MSSKPFIVLKLALVGFFFALAVAGLRSFSMAQKNISSQTSNEIPRREKSLLDYSSQLTDKEHIRNYLVHLPSTYNPVKIYPLVLVFHGAGGTAQGIQTLTDLNKIADTAQFIAVYPQGVGNSWADGRGTTPAEMAGIDDVGFVSALIDQLSLDLNLDRHKVYATGISNGGLLSHRLGCELSDKITAIAAVAATFPANLASKCHPQRAVSVLQIMGTRDRVIPLAGGTVSKGRGGTVLSNDKAISTWLNINNCNPTPVKTILPDTSADSIVVEHHAYQNCKDASQVQNYIIRGGGHTWPGGNRINRNTSQDIKASSTIWQFFSQFTRI